MRTIAVINLKGGVAKTITSNIRERVFARKQLVCAERAILHASDRRTGTGQKRRNSKMDISFEIQQVPKQ